MEFEYVSEDIFAVSEFLTKAQCDEYIHWGEFAGFDDAPITTSRGPVMRKDIRNNDRVMLDDVQRASSLWELLKGFGVVQPGWEAIGLNERFRLYRYQAGQVFRMHRDGAFQRSASERSFWTFLVYLNEGFVGGETLFSACSVTPKVGKALCFRHRLLHEGAMVEEGCKYVLRTDVMFQRVGG
ncbi:MAG: hypothetical protein CL920_25695 [Deltaproteobacteria bacterium]|nr:hypothetical protein [Deltaproteobacteria bacterium]MBU52101.1 hypothetical protein [Deltaproteobacteria bacterium]